MKPFDDLTEAELIALTHADAERYVDYLCAEEGIPLLPSALPEPPEVEYRPEGQIYSVGHWLHFTDQAEALAVAEVINRSRSRVETRYLSTPSGVTSMGIGGRVLPITVGSEQAFSSQQCDQLATELANAKTARDAYEKSKKAYDDAVRGREHIWSRVNEAIDTAHAADRERADMRRLFARYRELANGDATVAWRFLERAYPNAASVIPDDKPVMEAESESPSLAV